jgi:hypothetical protein
MGLLFVLFVVSLSCVNALQKLSPTPPMGWSTWCTESGIVPCYDDFCSEEEILSIAESMTSTGMLKKGFNWIFLDDCWAAKNRSASGKILEDRTRFPSGMANFTRKLHQMNFKISLYTDVGATTCRGGRLGSWPHYQDDANTFALDWEVRVHVRTTPCFNLLRKRSMV